MNIELRPDGYYAVLMIPKDLRLFLGKVKYLKKLSATNKSKASLEASSYILLWKQEIKSARLSLGLSKDLTDFDIYQQALGMRAAIGQASQNPDISIDGISDRDQVEILASDIAEEIEASRGIDKAQMYYQIATGIRTPLQNLYQEWANEALVGHALKTIDSYKRDCFMFVNEFKYVEAINRKAVKNWVSKLQDEGVSPHTLSKRILSAVRHFYRFIDGKGLIDDSISDPFYKVVPLVTKTKSTRAKKGWGVFSNEDLVKLYAAVDHRDVSLKFLMLLAMYSGARIEELCSLKVADFIDKQGINCFAIRDSKTRAGVRIVPLHNSLEPLINYALSLRRPKGYPYLITGLSTNKYGALSNAIGKRFGRLKKAMGFGPELVFHSIRKCVITQLEQRGFPESVVADLVGHEKATITYGLYSGGSSLEAINNAVQAIKYDLNF